MKLEIPRSLATGLSARRSIPGGVLVCLALLVCFPLGCSRGEKANKPPAQTVPTPTPTRSASPKPSSAPEVFTVPAVRPTPRPASPEDLESTPTTAPPNTLTGTTLPGKTENPAGKSGSASVQTTPRPTAIGGGPGATPVTSVPGATPSGSKTVSDAGNTGQGQEDTLRQFVNSGGVPAATSGENENANSNGASGTSGSGLPAPTRTYLYTHPTPAPTVGPPTATPPAPTPEAGQVSVYVYPTNMPTVAGKSFTLMVMMDSNEKAVSDYTASILYNPLKLRFDGLRNGDDPILGNVQLKLEEKDQDGQPRGVLHILTVQTASLDRPIGPRIMVARLDFTALEPGTTNVEIAGATVDNTSQDRMQVSGLGGSQVTIAAPPQP